ncbi:probable peptidoglycan muropeptide transporter SLC46 [Planococcus citri]|uniref:probable peptidoglycan muropeptide transporter SLC46 n=1 Tax=Planococcus citri TaxID=170843 RepID=UPI0031F94A0B
MSFRSNIWSVLKNVTVEPAVLFYFLSHVMIDVINTNLYLQKSCRLNATSEPNLQTPCDDEKLGLIFVSSFNAKYSFIQLIPMLILIVLMMSWSDEAGMKRKILIVLPIIGMIFQSINGCLQTYFWTWSASYAAMTNTALQVFSGGFLLMWYSSQLHVCDKSTPDNRTLRIGILTALKYICSPIGNGMAGYLIRKAGFFKSFLVCLVLASGSLVSAAVLVQDADVPVQKKVSLWGLFKITRVIDSFRVVFKRSLGRKRVVVLLLLLVHATVLFSEEGERSVFYLFMRYKFKWNELMFGKYQTYKLGGIIVGTIFCSGILSKLCKLHDGVIGTFAGFWDIWAALGYVFASQVWHLYLIPLLDIFHGTAIIVNFSFLTQFYDRNEFGRLNAVYNAFSLLVSFSYPTYNIIFQKTMNHFPSAVFLVSVVINTAVCVLYAGAYFLTKKLESENLTISTVSTARVQRHVCGNQPNGTVLNEPCAFRNESRVI